MAASSTALVKASDYSVLSDPATALEIVRDTLAGQEVTEFDLTRIRIPSGGGTAFEIPSKIGEEDEVVKAIQGVMLFTKTSRAYWKAKYAGGSEPPDCSSANGVTAQARVDLDTGKSMEIPADHDETTGHLLCDTCQFNQWGTATDENGTRTRGKACREARQVFILTPKRLLPVVIALPPTSLQSFKHYLLGLGEVGKNWHHVVTSVSLEKVSGSGPDYSMAKFAVGEALDEEQVRAMDAYRAAAEPALNTYATVHAQDAHVEEEPLGGASSSN